MVLKMLLQMALKRVRLATRTSEEATDDGEDDQSDKLLAPQLTQTSCSRVSAFALLQTLINTYVYVYILYYKHVSVVCAEFSLWIIRNYTKQSMIWENKRKIFSKLVEVKSEIYKEGVLLQ